MTNLSIGRTELLQEEIEVNLETITKGIPANEAGKQKLIKILAYDYHICMVNGKYPEIKGIVYQIVKKGNELILKPAKS